MPSVGMSPGDVHLSEWLKQPGDRVVAGETVALVETDKAELSLEAPVDGTLGRHLFPASSDVPAGSVVARVLEAGEIETDEVSLSTGPTPHPSVASDDLDIEIKSPSQGHVLRQHSDRERRPGTEELEPYVLSPRKRSASAVTPGQVGLIEKADLTAESSKLTQPERQPALQADQFRAAVSKSVSRSWAEVPHFSVAREIRAEGLLESLRSIRALDSQVTLTDVLVKTFALSLVERVGALSINLGLAVATPRGVAIPVLTSVATMSLPGIAAQRRLAVTRALEGRMTEDDTRVPHSTLSNLGALEVDSFTAIVPYGQTSILSIGSATKKPVVDGETIVIGTTVCLTLNVDHRTWDGQHAAEVLARLADLASEPGLLLSLH